MPEENATEIRIPNPEYSPNPEKFFDEAWGFRLIWLSESDGVRALIGRLKAELPKTVTRVRTYIFMKDGEWTMAKAQDWVNEHVKASLDEVLYEDEPEEREGFFSRFWNQVRSVLSPKQMEDIEVAAAMSEQGAEEFAVRVGDYMVQGNLGFPLAAKNLAWGWGAKDVGMILGPNEDNWDLLKKAHLLIDVSSGDLPKDKAAYMFPVASIASGGLAYNWKGISLVLGYLHGVDGVDVPDDVKKAVYSTLRTLYRRFDEEVPELRLGGKPEGTAFFDSFSSKLEEKEGLVWKHLLRVGTWPGERDRGPITITIDMLKSVKDAFEANVLPHVSVPLTHTDNPRANTGFVEAVELRGDELWVGIKFTEPEIKKKVKNGTIANVSAFLQRGWQEVKTGKKWPWVLWHVALTNLPLVPDLKPFLASVGASEDTCVSYSLSEEVNDMADKELEAQLEAERERARQLEAALQEKAGETETLQASLEAEKQGKGDLESQLSVATERARSLETEIARNRRVMHEADVKSMLLALQGKGQHQRVTLPDKWGFSPAIVKEVEPFLMADEGEEVAKFAMESEDKKSVTDVVLSLLNTIGQAKDSAMVSYSAKGEQSHKKIGDETSVTDKDKQVDEYMSERRLVAEEA